MPMRVNRLAGGDIAMVMPECVAARLWVELSGTADRHLLELRGLVGPLVINNKEDKTP